MPRNECGGPKAAKVSGKPKFSVIQGGKNDDHNPDADFDNGNKSFINEVDDPDYYGRGEEEEIDDED